MNCSPKKQAQPGFKFSKPIQSGRFGQNSDLSAEIARIRIAFTKFKISKISDEFILPIEHGQVKDVDIPFSNSTLNLVKAIRILSISALRS